MCTCASCRADRVFPLTDALRGGWLVERVGRWATVGGVAGTGFDASVRLLHPVHAHRSAADTLDELGVLREVEHTRWPWAEVARRNSRVMHPLVRFDPEDLAVLTIHLRTATLTPEDLFVGACDETSARTRRLMH